MKDAERGGCRLRWRARRAVRSCARPSFSCSHGGPLCAGTGQRGGPSSLPTTRPNGCRGARPRASIKTLLQERSLVHSAKATRAKRCTQIKSQKGQANRIDSGPALFVFLPPHCTSDSPIQVARGCGWGCASRLLILRVAVDDPAPSTPPRCRAAAVLYAAVRSHHGPDLYTRWGSPVASPSAGLMV